MLKKWIGSPVMTPVVEVLGCLLVAVGIYNFAVLADFPMSGFTGIALIIYRLTGLPIGVSTIILNIPVALLCYRLLGRRFFLHSLWCMLLSAVMIDYLAPLFPAYHGDRLLAALCCGVIAGTGYAIIYMQNASTGGSDFIVMAIKAWRPHLSLGRVIFLSDLVIVLAGGIIFQDMDGMIYGLIINYLFAIVADKLMYGVNSGKVLLIVTGNSALVRQTIEETSRRGCTLWQAKGGYREDPREVVMCACDNKQMYNVQQAVDRVDPAAFTIVLESSEVAGEGFKRLVVGEKK